MDELAIARADILKAIAQPTRLKILELLRDGERCVCEIFPAIDEEQSNTSRHLNLMQGSWNSAATERWHKDYVSVEVSGST